MCEHVSTRFILLQDQLLVMRVPLSSDLSACLGHKFEALNPILDKVEALSIQTAVDALVLGLSLH